MAAQGDYHRPDQKKIQALKDLANKLRVDSIEMTNASGSGYVPNVFLWGDTS